MTSKEDLRDSSTRQTQTHPSEAEVSEILREAEQKYEEGMRVADLADITQRPEEYYPKYPWDNPIGLVVTE